MNSSPPAPDPASTPHPHDPPRPAESTRTAALVVTPTTPAPPALDAPLPSLSTLLKRVLSSRHLAATLLYGVLLGLLLLGLLLLPVLYDPETLRLVLPVYEALAVDGLWLLGVALSISAARHLGQDPAQVFAAVLTRRTGPMSTAGMAGGYGTYPSGYSPHPDRTSTWTGGDAGASSPAGADAPRDGAP